MKTLTSLGSEKTRKTFWVFYVLSSLLPVLILLFILFQYLYPYLSEEQKIELMTPLTAGLSAMVLVPLLGVVLMSKIIRSLENLTEEVQTRAAELIQHSVEVNDQNEMSSLHQHFETLYNELQSKIDELQTQSQTLAKYKTTMAEMASPDKLTQMRRRPHFEIRLKEETKRAEKSAQPLAIIMLELADIRNYAKQHGKVATAHLLRGMSHLIRDSIRTKDEPYRYAGDQFVVMMPECRQEEAAAVAQKIIESSELLKFKGTGQEKEGRVRLICGVTVYRKGAADFLAEIDRCLEEARAAGAGRVVMCRPGPLH